MNSAVQRIARLCTKFVLITMLLCLAYLICVPVVMKIVARHRVLNADHQKVLAECRAMIKSYDKLTNEWGLVSENEKGLSFWSLDTGYTYHDDPRLPSAIRDLQPASILVSRSYMYIYLRRPARTYILADLDGYTAENRAKRYSTNSICLTNGLWYLE